MTTMTSSGFVPGARPVDAWFSAISPDPGSSMVVSALTITHVVLLCETSIVSVDMNVDSSTLRSPSRSAETPPSGASALDSCEGPENLGLGRSGSTAVNVLESGDVLSIKADMVLLDLLKMPSLTTETTRLRTDGRRWTGLGD